MSFLERRAAPLDVAGRFDPLKSSGAARKKEQ
jgi:hypothetical protein